MPTQITHKTLVNSTFIYGIWKPYLSAAKKKGSQTRLMFGLLQPRNQMHFDIMSLDIIWLKCGTFNKNYRNNSTASCFFLQTFLMRWPLHTRRVNIPVHVHTESDIIKKGPHHNTRTNSMPTSLQTVCPSTTIQVTTPTTTANTQMKWKVVNRF